MGKMTRIPGPSRKVVEDIAKSSGIETSVGFFPSAQYPDGTPIAYVATIQEYGCAQRSIPPRPFMRPTIDQRTNEWRRIATAAAKKVAMGGLTVEQAMDAIGLAAEGHTKETIASVVLPDLSPITMMARKFKKEGGEITSAKQIAQFAAELKENPNQDFSGVSDKPLNDSGAMFASVTHMTVKK